MKEKVYETLKKMDIAYEVVDHPPALTTELADKYIEGKEGVRSKTMFLSDKKKREFFLFILDDSKKLDIKALGEKIGVKGLRFGSEESLKEKMNLEFGVVSPFGLLNNEERDIKIYIDEELKKEKIITFHPNENDATVFISVTDMLKFFEKISYPYEFITM